MAISVRDSVEHPEFGHGIVEEVLGSIARVKFFGEVFDVTVKDLSVTKTYQPKVIEENGEDGSRHEMIRFRRAFEAINLGVVPPDPDQLIKLTIGSNPVVGDIREALAHPETSDLCRVVFGYYGSGKSHFLNLVRCVGLQSGWVVAYLEFDPKEADPAKPHLIYRNLMSALEFPPREDGTVTEGFTGLIKEVRDNWHKRSLRSLPLFRSSSWFCNAFEVLLRYPHSEDPDYVSGCNWLGGDYKSYEKITMLGRYKGYRYKVPRMPATKETADIYVFHLCVIAELCREIGYKGLLIIFDEAEHVRGYNVRRRERANNFFDILGRCAHVPSQFEPPYPNEHGIPVPQYWQNGPHFGLFVGLTEGTVFSDPYLGLREACVFAHKKSDCMFLHPPSPKDYCDWVVSFLKAFHQHYPAKVPILNNAGAIVTIAGALFELFSREDKSDIVLRNWIKLASLVPCILLSKPSTTLDELTSLLEGVAFHYVSGGLPWET